MRTLADTVRRPQPVIEATAGRWVVYDELADNVGAAIARCLLSRKWGKQDQLRALELQSGHLPKEGQK